MSDVFSSLIITLHNLGVFKFLIPYILTLAIFYGLLRKSKIFGEPEKNIAVNATVAASAAFLVAAAPIIAGIDITRYLSGFLIYIMFVIFAMMTVLFIPNIIFPTLKEFDISIDKKTIAIVFFLSLAIFIIIGLIVFNFFAYFPQVFASEEIYATVALLAFIFVFSLLIYFTLKPPEKS